jgi:tRNA dimethylallyltransferase
LNQAGKGRQQPLESVSAPLPPEPPPGPVHPEAIATPPDGVQPLTIALLGPTASGKTDLAIALAETLDLAVLSVDSRQLYRGMEVGTAKPSAAQRRRVRHELLDLRDPDQPITLQEFTALAEAAIAAEHRRRGVALLVGGSGLYLQALLAGLAPPAVAPQPDLRAQFAALGQAHCHSLLRQADPAAAARIAPADAVRTQRALEVLYATGRPISSQQGRRPPAWRVLELGLNPADLTERIRIRTRHLYDSGLVEETEALLARFGPGCALLETIGYSEACRLLAGILSREEAIALTERRTRQYAKRQRTWFRRRHTPIWLGGGDGAGGEEDLLRQAMGLAHQAQQDLG